MADDPTDQSSQTDKDNLDLNSLSSFSLGPDWVSGKQPKARLPKGNFDEHSRGSRAPRRERGGGPPRRARPERTRSEGRPSPRDRHERREREEPFQPILAADFYPEEEPFKVLSQAIKTSCRTFELFEIARLILDKPDRWVCVARDPAHKEGEPATMWACVPDGLPFSSEDEALSHAFRHYMGEFFNLETVEVEPPSGSFQMIHKCGMTGDLLAPPNYHRYQAICREHHAAKLGNVPYSRFEQRIESTREDEDIQAWLTQMKTQTRYTLKEDPEQVFVSREDARLYLVAQAKDKLVRPAYSARFSGKALSLLNPGDPVRRSVEYILEGQKRFPLDTANHLRGRLRRMHFAVYKKGSKGVSFVCAVKRHFRKPDEVLADNLQKLIDFLEAHPNFPAKDLPKTYLKLKKKPSDVAESPQQEAVKTESVDADEETAEVSVEEKLEAAKPERPELSPEDQAAIKVLKTDLHYLVSQGYVIEYSDGRLFVPPIREDEVRHLEKQKAAAEKADEETPTENEAKPASVDESEKAVPTAEEPGADEKTVPVPVVEPDQPAEPEESVPEEVAGDSETAPEATPEEPENAQPEAVEDSSLGEQAPDEIPEPPAEPIPEPEDKPEKPANPEA